MRPFGCLKILVCRTKVGTASPEPASLCRGRISISRTESSRSWASVPPDWTGSCSRPLQPCQLISCNAALSALRSTCRPIARAAHIISSNPRFPSLPGPVRRPWRRHWSWHVSSSLIRERAPDYALTSCGSVRASSKKGVGAVGPSGGRTLLRSVWNPSRSKAFLACLRATRYRRNQNKPKSHWSLPPTSGREDRPFTLGVLSR